MNFATIVVLIIIGAALCAAVFSMIRSRRKGGCAGCSGCSGCADGSECSGYGSCHSCGDLREDEQTAKKQ